MRHVVLLLLSMGAAACAFTDVPLELPTTIGTGLSGGDGRQIVVVHPFRDERADQRNRCGMQKNGYGMDTASAICSEDPAGWLAKLLATELQAAGFAVVEQASKPSAVTINGALLKIFVEPVAGFTTVALESDLEVKLLLESESGLEAERTFFVKGSASSMASGAGSFQRSLDDGAQRLVKDMVAAVLSLMNRYPQLGFQRSVVRPDSEVLG